MSNPGKPRRVVATRWWWVRHAPVREDDGCIYGQKDLGCDTSDRVVFEAVGKILPRNAVWYASNLKRTHQTAEAIWAAGFPKPASMPHEAAFAEQHLGQWQGHEPRGVSREPARSAATGLRRSTNPRPAARVSWISITALRGAIERINAEQAGRDVIAVGAWRNDQGGDRSCARRSAGKRPRLRHRQLFGDAARSSRKRRPSAAGGFRWSTSSRGSRMPRTTPCISRPGRRSSPATKLA